MKQSNCDLIVSNTQRNKDRRRRLRIESLKTILRSGLPHETILILTLTMVLEMKWLFAKCQVLNRYLS